MYTAVVELNKSPDRYVGKYVVLFFDYDDDNLRSCVDIVYSDTPWISMYKPDNSGCSGDEPEYSAENTELDVRHGAVNLGRAKTIQAKIRKVCESL